jgi:hypothetical protein
MSADSEGMVLTSIASKSRIIDENIGYLFAFVVH